MFKVESSVRQFFFGDLRPWVHYVPVSRERLESDLAEKVRWARANDAEAERIARRGRDFALRYVTHEAAWWYAAEVLAAFARRQVEPVQLDPRAQAFCCRDLRGVRDPRFDGLNLSTVCAARAPCGTRTKGGEAAKPSLYSLITSKQQHRRLR